MFNYGGGYGPGNSSMFQGALSRGVSQEDMNRLIEAAKQQGKPLPSKLNPPQGTSRTPIAVGTPSMDQVGNVGALTGAQNVAFNPFKMEVMPDNSVEFGGKRIDKNLYEQLKNNPERMRDYIRQQHLEEGGEKYF